MEMYDGGDLESIKAVEPDIEIVIRVGEQEVAVFGLFENKRDVWDVVVGVEDPDQRAGLMDALEIARSALEVATFQPTPSTGTPE